MQRTPTGPPSHALGRGLKKKAPGPEAADGQDKPDPEEQARQKAEDLEREKQRLLQKIAATATDDLRAKVGYVLSLYPDARNSDVTLANRLWQTFYPEYINGEYVRLDDMYRLPQPGWIARHRAKIQNEYGLFQPNETVARRRKGLREDTEKEVVADKPGPPVLSVHADESGKQQHYLVIGSVWIIDVSRMWRVANTLREFKAKAEIKYEFKFSDLTKAKLDPAKNFVLEAMKHSDLIGLKACVLDTSAVKGMATEDMLYRLYYELAMTGMKHEIDAGRVVLPRWLHIVKDQDAGPDALLLPDVERRLKVGCKGYFKDSVEVESVTSGVSTDSPLLQLADLFAGSVGRIFNKTDEVSNQKDAFAAFFQGLAGFDFTTESKGTSDFMYIHRLGK